MNKNSSIFYQIYLLNWQLIMLIILMSSIGFAMLYSAAQGNISPWAGNQIIRFAIMFPVMIIIAITSSKFWYNTAYFIYGTTLILLIFVEFFGFSAMGAKRWVNLGPINLQPSELMKIAIIFALARFYHGIHPDYVNKFTNLIIPVLLIIIPFFLIIRQPDLGTGLIMLMIGIAMVFLSGVKIWFFVVPFIVSLSSIPFIWNLLHGYQQKRILTFLNPEADPLGDGYNLMQSIIAIGSGGLWGKGFLKGSQSQLSFLPEKQTDFIFTMLTEEFGLAGGIFIIFIYILILAQTISISIYTRSFFSKMMSMGISIMLFLHIFINMAMVMGLIPIVGAPLPLLSYGGTILITTMIAFGLILNSALYNEDNIEKKYDF